MTNWKYILIVVILAIFVGGGTLYQWQMLKEEAQVSETEIPEKVAEVPKEEIDTLKCSSMQIEGYSYQISESAQHYSAGFF